jgi:hypothetical protein
MTLSYAVYSGSQLLKVFSYDTRDDGEKEKALQRARDFASWNASLNCTLEHFGLGGVGVTVK